MLGVATSGATLFRSIGGAIGTAILGSIFTNRLDTVLASSGAPAGVGTLDPSGLQRLPPQARATFIEAFTDALDLVFLVAACVLAVAFLVAWLLEERPLRTTVATAGMHEAFATPEHPDSVRTVARELSRLVGREGAADFVRRTTARAGLDVSPLEGWVLVRTAADRTLDVPGVAQTSDLEEELVRDACRELHRRGLLTHDGDAGTGLTADGAAAVSRPTGRSCRRRPSYRICVPRGFPDAAGARRKRAFRPCRPASSPSPPPSSPRSPSRPR
jgi:hypothetical protein